MDVVVVDPPFITEEVWRKYAITAKLLLKPEGRFRVSLFQICTFLGSSVGKVILTTIAENKDLLFELFGATPTVS
jgi:hypothetical protein